MFKMNTLFTLLSTAMLFISSTYAADLETLQKQRGSSQRSLTLSGSVGSNLNKTSTADHSFDSSFSVDPSIALEGGTLLLANLSFRKELEGERKEYFNDVYVGATKSFFQKGAYSLSYLALGFIPLSKSSQEDTYLNTSFLLAPSLNINFAHWGVKGLAVTLRPSLRSNFHRYKTSMSGSSNSQFVTSGLLSLYYYFSDKLYLSLRNSYAKSFTYNGNTTDSYQLSQALSYRASKNTRVEFGHTNGGSPLAPNGTDTDIELFNARSSQVYTALSYTF